MVRYASHLAEMNGACVRKSNNSSHRNGSQHGAGSSSNGGPYPGSSQGAAGGQVSVESFFNFRKNHCNFNSKRPSLFTIDITNFSQPQNGTANGTSNWKLSRVFTDPNNSTNIVEDTSLINRKLPKELLLRIFYYLDVVSLCRCAQVRQFNELNLYW